MSIPENSIDLSNLTADKVTRDIAKHIRSEDQTFLTYPEWFLVFSPEELSDFLKINPQHKFEFTTHISQFWDSYRQIKQETSKYPYNSEYHTMIKVIGYSTTVEYTLKSIYENTFGRLSWFFSNKELTSEDKLIAQYTDEYVNFIKIHPWYKFDFYNRIKPIWTLRNKENDSFIRSIERRMLLTSEFFIKSIYAKLINWGTKNSFEKPIMFTVVKTNKPIDIEKFNSILSENIKEYEKCSITNFNKQNDGIYLFPRYQAFTTCLKAFQAYNATYTPVSIKEIAGNKDIILVSALSKNNLDKYGKEILKQELISQKGTFRVLIMLNINDLDIAIPNMISEGVNIEHIFDF